MKSPEDGQRPSCCAVNQLALVPAVERRGCFSLLGGVLLSSEDRELGGAAGVAP